MGGGGHVSVTLADLDVDNDVGVAVEGGLEDHVVLFPYFDDPKLQTGLKILSFLKL